MTSKIKILILSKKDKNFNFDLSIYDVKFLKESYLINVTLGTYRPNIIFSFDNIDDYPELFNCSFEIRKKWIHFSEDVGSHTLHICAQNIYSNLIKSNLYDIEPLVSIVTPTYNSYNLFSPYQSLLAQYYKNWEWIIYDDGSTDKKCLNMIDQIASIDLRVKVIKSSHNGSIGQVKHNAFMSTSGKYLLELDHDDELTPWCISKILEAFNNYPDAGFAYTDCSEIIRDGYVNAVYPDGWGFGYGSYRKEELNKWIYDVTNYPSINSKTVRHIVGMPNHARCWTKEFYNSIDGHNQNLFVADDYDLCVRTFLNTRMIHVQTFGYIQYHHSNNTQNSRNAQIQELVSIIGRTYEKDIHNRFEELGVEDFIWKDGILNWSLENPQHTPIANYIYQ